MELVKSGTIEMLSRRSVAIKDYSVENGDEDEERCDESDRTSLKIDLSMAEQFYYEVISSFEQEEVYRWFQIHTHTRLYINSLHFSLVDLSTPNLRRSIDRQGDKR